VLAGEVDLEDFDIGAAGIGGGTEERFVSEEGAFRAGRGGGAGVDSTIPPKPNPPNRGAPCLILLVTGAGRPWRKTPGEGEEAGIGEVGREGGLEGM